MNRAPDSRGSGTSGKSEGRIAPVVRPASAAEPIEVKLGTSTSVQMLIGPADAAPNFHLRRFTMEEGGGMPLHTNLVEHEQYVLGGRAEVRIGKNVHQVKTGDVLLIPAGAPHSYRAVEGRFEFLCIVPATEDRIDLVEDPPSA